MTPVLVHDVMHWHKRMTSFLCMHNGSVSIMLSQIADALNSAGLALGAQPVPGRPAVPLELVVSVGQGRNDKGARQIGGVEFAPSGGGRPVFTPAVKGRELIDSALCLEEAIPLPQRGFSFTTRQGGVALHGALDPDNTVEGLKLDNFIADVRCFSDRLLESAPRAIIC